MQSIPELQIIGKIALAALLGLFIGIERHANGKIAGVRTFSTLALGTALFTILGAQLFTGQDQVIFLAAMIIGTGIIASKISVIDNDGVPEFSNMVALWTTAAISIAISYGYYILGSGVAFLLLAIYLIKDLFETRSEKRSKK